MIRFAQGSDGIKRNCYIVSLVKHQVSAVKLYGRGRTYVPVACFIIFFIGLLYGEVIWIWPDGTFYQEDWWKLVLRTLKLFFVLQCLVTSTYSTVESPCMYINSPRFKPFSLVCITSVFSMMLIYVMEDNNMMSWFLKGAEFAHIFLQSTHPLCWFY